MHRITLTRAQANILPQQLENKPDGFKVPDLRKLQRVEAAIEAQVSTPLTDENAQEAISLLFEDDEFNFIKTVWSTLGGFRGARQVQALVLGIDDALNAAETVTLAELQPSAPEAANGHAELTHLHKTRAGK